MESMPPSADDDDNIYDTPENNDFEADDNVLLAEDEDFNVPGCSKNFTPSLRDLFDRSKVGCGVSSTGDLEGLQLSNVHAYDAKQLESKLCEHADITVKQIRADKSKSAFALKVFHKTESLIKSGEMTPFELMMEKQAKLEKCKDVVRKSALTITNPLAKRCLKNMKNKSTTKKDCPRKRASRDSGQFDHGSEDSHNSGSSDYQPSSFAASSDVDSGESSDTENFSQVTDLRSSKTKTGAKKRNVKDDGCEKNFLHRIQLLKELRPIEFDDNKEMHPLKDGYTIAGHVWNKLYKYQRTGVRWLHELHDQYVGGILADEMGLGKTIQICVFLRSLFESRMRSRIFNYKGLGPTLIVCPATLMHQWVKELNEWFPLCLVAVLHSSGAHSGPKYRLINKVGACSRTNTPSVLITSYSTYTKEHKQILKTDWHYVILDEGHKIRNPEAKVTLSLKELKTPHRIILSGSPLQNNLKELWSLIDFVYPGRLGSLKEFMERFSIPITQGGYANATSVQVRTAYKCACLLRDAIAPYMLRRMKKDVESVLHLPGKSEQILFCDITKEQRRLYQDYLDSKECGRILGNKMDPFVGLITLRKLCNHPDLVNGGPNRNDTFDTTLNPEMEFGAYCRSGKMLVMRSLLRLWFEQKQKVLLFSQSRQMLTIIEKFVIIENYLYLRMDGTTPISKRQDLVTSFNNDVGIFLFLLTTRVGGLGVNLTGANRVLIFDPDWNPSTDSQAKERAWRIGQTRDVTIYRLLTSGTIEEKIYQRQIFKHFLASKVLIDPKQQRFFKTNDLHELFTLSCEKVHQNQGSETAAIFASTTTELNRKNFFDERDKRSSQSGEKKFNQKSCTKQLPDLEDDEEFVYGNDIELKLSGERIAELRQMAKMLSKNMDFLKPTSRPSTDNTTKKEDKKAKRKKFFENEYEIPYLVKQKKMKGQNEADLQGMTSTKEQDDYVLRNLLKNTGVSSALGHDQIINGIAAPDLQLIEDEANAVANRAADVLKRSQRVHAGFRRDCSLFGKKQASMPKEDAMPGKRSSADLLKSIYLRKEKMLEPDNPETATAEFQNYPSLEARLRPRLAVGDRFEELAEDVKTFFIVNDGRASTEQVLTKFKDVVSPSDSFAFRAILKKFCKFMPNSQWVLRDEYK